MPEPLLPVAVVAKSKADEDKLSQGLGRLVAEDPTLRLEHNPETHQLVLWCMGEAHVDVLLDRLRNRYGVDVESVPLRVSLRETFAGTATGPRPAREAVRRPRAVRRVRHRGRAARRPAPGFEFVDKVVGGAVPRQFIPSVEKGVRTQMERGVAAGYPVVDIRVTLIDGKAHSVDSSDMAFQTAGALALKEAAKATTVHMLEPVDELSVLVSDEYVGAVMSDLSTRRGRVTGTEPVGTGRTLVKAEVPAGGDHAVRRRPALAVARHRHVLPRVRPARADAQPHRCEDPGRGRRQLTPRPRRATFGPTRRRVAAKGRCRVGSAAAWWEDGRGDAVGHEPAVVVGRPTLAQDQELVELGRAVGEQHVTHLLEAEAIPYVPAVDEIARVVRHPLQPTVVSLPAHDCHLVVGTGGCADQKQDGRHAWHHLAGQATPAGDDLPGIAGRCRLLVGSLLGRDRSASSQRGVAQRPDQARLAAVGLVDRLDDTPAAVAIAATVVAA